MTNQEITGLFYYVIQEKAIYNKLEGISRNTVFNWLNERSTPTVGDMLNVLYQLGKINIVLNDVVKSIDREYTISSIPVEGMINLSPEEVKKVWLPKK